MNEILGQIGEAFVLLRADGSKLSEDMKKEKDKLEKDLTKWGGRLKGLGGAMSAGITAPIAAIGAAAITAGYVIDDALDNIRIKSGATGAALDDLTLSFKNVFKDVPDSAAAVSDAIAEVNRRTGATGPLLDNLAKQQLNLARITKTELNANIESSAHMFTAWNIATDKQASSLDFVFKTAQKTGTSVTDLMQKVTQFRPILQEFGFSWEESIALMGQWTAAGLNAEQILGALRIAAKHFAEAGVPMRQGLEETLRVIQKLGPGTQSTNLAIQVFGKSGITMADAIHKGALSVDDLLEQLRKSPETIDKAVGATDGFAEGLKRLQNQATLALEPLGTRILAMAEKVLPFFIRAGELAIGAAEAFGKLPAPLQEIIIVFGGVAAAAGPVIYAVGTLIGSLKTIATVFGTAAATGTTATGVIGGMGIAATATSIALGAIGIAIAGWSLYKIGQAASLIWDLRNQSVQAAKDMEYAQTQAQRNIQLAFEKTGFVTKDAAKANSVLQAYNAGLRQEQLKLTLVSKDQYLAWQKGTEEAKKKGASVQNLTRDTKAQTQSEGGLKIATNATADAQAQALLKQLGLNDGKKAGKKDTDEYAEALKRLNAQLGGEDVTKNAKMYLEVLGGTGKIAGLTRAELDQAASALLAFIEKMERAGTTTTAQFRAAKSAYADVMAELRKTDIDERIKRISETFSGEELRRNAEAYIGYLQQIGTTTGLTREETNLIVAELEKYLDRMRELGQVTTEEFDRVRKARDELLLPNKPISMPGIDLTKIPLPGAGMINQKVANTVYNMGGKIADFFKKGVLGGMKPGDFGNKVGDLILGAFQGGGDVGKSVGGLIGGNIGKWLSGGISKSLGGAAGKLFGATAGKFIGGALGSVIPGIGTFLGGMLGDFIGKGLGKVMGKIGGFFKSLFGGPSKKELAGREAVAAFEDQLRGTASEAQVAQSFKMAQKGGGFEGNQKGALTAIVVTDAYVAAGRTAKEGNDAAAALWAATKKGPEAVRSVMFQIYEVTKSSMILDWLQNNKIPEFERGGYGDFGRGTPAMLHGKELILPERKLEQLQSASFATMQRIVDRLNAGQSAFGASFAKVFERMIASGNAVRAGRPIGEETNLSKLLGAKLHTPALDLARSLHQTGAIGSVVNFSPTFKGTLDHEMKGLIRSQLWPQFLDVLRESAQLRAEAQTVINNVSVT